MSRGQVVVMLQPAGCGGAEEHRPKQRDCDLVRKLVLSLTCYSTSLTRKDKTRQVHVVLMAPELVTFIREANCHASHRSWPGSLRRALGLFIRDNGTQPDGFNGG